VFYAIIFFLQNSPQKTCRVSQLDAPPDTQAHATAQLHFHVSGDSHILGVVGHDQNHHQIN
jgi:hypothetical protein